VNDAGETFNKMGYSVKMNMDDTEAICVVRAAEAMSIGDFADALEDIAAQYREKALEDWNGDH
jgi:pyruvate/2-oxoglutarate dehydrogenase complex dihydrolipoamide acyltransferase (E2) component